MAGLCARGQRRKSISPPDVAARGLYALAFSAAGKAGNVDSEEAAARRRRQGRRHSARWKDMGRGHGRHNPLASREAYAPFASSFAGAGVTI